MVTFSSPTPPQDLSEDIENQLLEALLCAHTAPAASPSSSPTSPTSDISPLSLSRRFNISLHLVLDFLARSDTRARLAAALECSDILHHQHTQRARTRALVALESILEKSEDPIEIRRAATAILRPSRAVSPSSIRAHRDPPEDFPRTLRPAPIKPSTTRDAQHTLYAVLDRLSDASNPTPDAGLTSLHNHLDPAAGFSPDLPTFLSDPGEAIELANARTFVLHPPTPGLNKDTHEQWASLTWPNLVVEHVRFQLKTFRPSTLPLTAWRITNIYFHGSTPTNSDDDDDAEDTTTGPASEHPPEDTPENHDDPANQPTTNRLAPLPQTPS